MAHESESSISGLKPLDQIQVPDVPYQGQISIEALHARLASIALPPSVPRDVRQQFETAKNVMLYSWFAYRLHQVAELQAYVALEMALKARFQSDEGWPPDPRRQSERLGGLLRRAQEQMFRPRPYAERTLSILRSLADHGPNVPRRPCADREPHSPDGL